VAFRAAGLDRWLLRVNATAEAGSNAGSDFELMSRTDAGGVLQTVLRVIRSTGIATWSTLQIFSAAFESIGTARFFRDVTVPTEYFEIVPATGGIYRLTLQVPTGQAFIDISAKPLDGVSFGIFRFFRQTNTTAETSIQICQGNNTSSIQHRIGGNLNSYFHALSGDFGIGTTNPRGKHHTYDGTANWLSKSLTSIDGTAQTIMPNAAGDVLVGVLFNFIATDGTVVVATSGVFVLLNATYAIVVGASTYTVTVASTGAITVARSAGAGTLTKLALFLMWL
jgi:hypothetical protein